MGVIDGHDVKALRRALTQALGANRPVVVHIKTVKGKGFAPAEEGGLEGMEKWHAAKPGSVQDGREAPKQAKAKAAKVSVPSEPPQYTEVFGQALVDGGAARPARDRDHGRDGGRHGTVAASPASCPTTTTTSASPSSTRCCSRPASRSRG